MTDEPVPTLDQIKADSERFREAHSRFQAAAAQAEPDQAAMRDAAAEMKAMDASILASLAAQDIDDAYELDWFGEEALERVAERTAWRLRMRVMLGDRHRLLRTVAHLEDEQE